MAHLMERVPINVVAGQKRTCVVWKPLSSRYPPGTLAGLRFFWLGDHLATTWRLFYCTILCKWQWYKSCFDTSAVLYWCFDIQRRFIVIILTFLAPAPWRKQERGSKSSRTEGKGSAREEVTPEKRLFPQQGANWCGCSPKEGDWLIPLRLI